MGRPRNTTRKCKLCGREFVPESASDRYCKGVCAMFAKVNGGSRGESQEGTAHAGKYPRVDAMFKLPLEKRWAVASTFTKEEQAYSLRVQKRMLFAESRGDPMADDEWDMPRDSIGESDDGTV